MSLLITNKKTLGNVALVTISNENFNLKIEKKGDLTLIKSDEKVVGLNINNFQNYFDAKEGAHTINEEQIGAIKNMGFEINNPHSLFSIGEVISRENHPKSDKLFLLKVKTAKIVNIVTNTLNSTVGTKVVVANTGATLPSGVAIVSSKLVGVESQGMLCGGETLGKEKTNGILIPNGEVGDDYIL